MLPKDERQSGIANFPPGYFALVMATGIVSIAFHRLGIWVIVIPLFWLNVVFYIALWAITRWVRSRRLCEKLKREIMVYV